MLMRVCTSTLWLAVFFLAVVRLGSAQGSSPASPAVVEDNSASQPADKESPAGPSSADATERAKKASDAAGKVEQDIANARGPLDSGDRYQKIIANITAIPTKHTQPVFDDLQTIQATVAAIQQLELVGALTKARKSLDSSQSDSDEAVRKSLCDNLLQPSGGDQANVTEAQTRCTKVQKEAADRFLTLGQMLTTLQRALLSIEPYFANQAGILTDQLRPYKRSARTP